jgi:AcrR family transcriptional regulator
MFTAYTSATTKMLTMSTSIRYTASMSPRPPPASRTSRTGPARRPRTYHHGDLRRALTDAALALVAERGPEGFTLREAARRAGVTHAAPYRHFASKNALLAAAAEEGFRDLQAAMNRALVAADDDPMAQVKALGIAYVRHAVGHPAHFRVMFDAGGVERARFPSLANAALATFGLLSDAIARCQAARRIPAGDTADLALPAWAIVHGLSALIVNDQLAEAGIGEQRVEQLADIVTSALQDGLTSKAPRRGAPPRSSPP